MPPRRDNRGSGPGDMNRGFPPPSRGGPRGGGMSGGPPDRGYGGNSRAGGGGGMSGGPPERGYGGNSRVGGSGNRGGPPSYGGGNYNGEEEFFSSMIHKSVAMIKGSS